MKIREDVTLGQHSHVGLARTANEDFFGYWESDEERVFDLKGRLAVVCDGMGGHAGGEVASRMAVKTIIQEYESDPSENVMEALRRSIESANEIVFREAQQPENKQFKGMGTTVTVVVQRRDVVYFGQVGDSRAYLIRGGAIQQMTKDHSLVQQLVDEGLLEESEMENHPDKNVILRSLGVKKSVEVDISYAPLAIGDIYLLCSDGLSSLVNPEEMLRIVSGGVERGLELRKICEQLVDLANNYGGHDNITVQLLRVNHIVSGATDTTAPETVTQAFSPAQVEASIAQARKQAAQRGAGSGAGSTKTEDDEVTREIRARSELDSDEAEPTGKTAPMPVAVIPDTDHERAIPALEERAGGGIGAMLLVAGLLVGLALGLGIMALVAGLGEGEKLAQDARSKARAAAKVAEGNSRSGAVGNSELRARAQRELEQGELAFRTGSYPEAQAHFHTARTLFHLAGGRDE